MKIALVSFGHIDVVLPLFKNLKNRDVAVDLILCFALNRKSESILDFTDKKINTGFLSDEKINEILPDGIKKYLSDISSVNFFIFHNLKLKSVKNFLLSLILVKKLKTYDIIHFNGTNGVLPVLIFLLRKRKLVFTIHDIHSHSGEKPRYNFAERLNGYIIKSRFPLVVQNYSGYKYLIKKYSPISEKFNFIPFGVLDIYNEFKNKNTEIISSDLLFFGRISPYKGIEYLIEAIKKLKTEGVTLNAIIAGPGYVYFQTKDLEKFGIKLINRYLKNEELVSLIENTKVVICPYKDATQSGVVMTAFAFNKPVVASYVGSFIEVIKDGITGFLVPPQDSNELASKIKLLISDPVLIEQMRNNIHAFVTYGEYAWKHIGKTMQKLYSSVSPEGKLK
ncbi:MAG: glycosyltransferase family 4 protein [Bacteroidales bacterium]